MRNGNRASPAAWAGLAAGLALLAAAAVPVWLADRVEQFGDAPAPQSATDLQPSDRAEQPVDAPTSYPASVGTRPPGWPADGRSPAQARGIDDRDRGGAPALVGTRTATLGDREARADAAPTRIQIESVGIDAAVDPVGVGRDGALEIPWDVERAGWFRHGPEPGHATGSAVIAAHVDDRDGPGAFFDLPRVREGAEVTVETVGGDRVSYEVVALARYAKEDLPVADLFALGGPHRLALITCGGAFDEATRTYADNIVVIAEPSPAHSPDG